MVDEYLCLVTDKFSWEKLVSVPRVKQVSYKLESRVKMNKALGFRTEGLMEKVTYIHLTFIY